MNDEGKITNYKPQTTNKFQKENDLVLVGK